MRVNGPHKKNKDIQTILPRINTFAAVLRISRIFQKKNHFRCICCRIKPVHCRFASVEPMNLPLLSKYRLDCKLRTYAMDLWWQLSSSCKSIPADYNQQDQDLERRQRQGMGKWNASDSVHRNRSGDGWLLTLCTQTEVEMDGYWQCAQKEKEHLCVSFQRAKSSVKSTSSLMASL